MHLLALHMVVVQHAFVGVTKALLFLLDNLFDNMGRCLLRSRLLNYYHSLRLRLYWLGLRLLDDLFDPLNFNLLLDNFWWLLAHVDRVSCQKTIPVVMLAVLVAHKALDVKWVPVVTPVMTSTPGSIFANHAHRA